ncbi:MAG: cadmium-translocating P-type ATPase [Verrucomicrobia bacterium]|nr:cadmium-translocating P-type ATPase [Verrucomicrobiota bacterium]
MNSSDASKPAPPASDPNCLVHSVADALTAEPTLEAVTIDRKRHAISVATLGNADIPRLTQQIQSTIQQAQSAAPEQQCRLLAGNGDCSACEIVHTPMDRRDITIKEDADSITIARVTCPTAPKFWRWRDIPWPKVVQRDVEFLEHAEHLDEWKTQLAAAILCGTFGIAAFFIGHGAVARIFYVLAYVAGARFAAEEVWERMRKATIDVHFLMLAVAAGSASIGAWGEGTMLLFLFSLSGALEHYALGRTQREIQSLFKDAPKVAAVLDEHGHEHELPVEQLRPGLRLLIKPGAQFPVDAEIVKGRSAADESNLTGEATPVEKAEGDTVLAGTLNLWGAVEASVLRPAAQSALQKIVHLIKEAQQQKAPAQRFTDRFSTYYTYVVLGLSFAMFFVWWLGFQFAPFTSSETTRSAFYRAMTLLVVASPCALVLSIPSAVLAAIAWGARRGILFRGGAAVEKLADVQVVALDKTGTLTTGELKVERVESFPPGREDEVAQLAYSLERLSTHPLARAITRHGKLKRLVAIEFDHFESITGQGLSAERNGKTFKLGRRSWVTLAPGSSTPAEASAAGLAEVWLAGDGLLGRVILRDDIRPQAKLIIAEMRSANLRTVVLTGDRRANGEHLRRELELDDVRSELKPEQKVEAIVGLSTNGQRVAMVGDGVNDAPSLAAAHVGIAMGARGADAALEQADVVLMHDRLENFLAAFRLSQRARRIIRQNLFISLGTVAVLVVFALLGRIPLTLGVIGHEGSTVIVVMNSLRLLFSGRRARA